MSDLTRYEKELAQELKNLPLPNEDAAWEDMSKLLDKNRDKGAPPPNWGNIALGSLMGAALLIGLLWLTIGSHKTDNKSINNNKTTAGNTTNNNSLQANNNDTKSTVENSSNDVTTGNNNTTSGSKNDIKNNTGISSAKATNNNTVNSNTTSINSNSTKNNTENKNDQSGTNNTINANTNPTNSGGDAKNNTGNNNEQLSTNNEVRHIVKNTNNNSKKNDVANNTINSDKIHTGNDEIRNYHHKNVHKQNIVTGNTVAKKATNNNSNTTAASLTFTHLNSNHPRSANKKSNHNGYQLNNKKRPLNNTIARSTTKKASQNADAIDNNNVSPDGTEAATTGTDVTENKTEVKRTNKARHTALAYHQQATAAVSSKKSRLHTSKKNTVVISKSKTKIKILTAGTVNDDVEEIDTTDNTRLIKIGTAILAKKKAKHPIIKKDTANTLATTTKDATKKKDEKKKQLNIAVGIAEQQAMRLTCDCIYPNDAYTKTSLATDYIPSVFVRIQPTKKWFVQAEFKYKAPQYLQEALYSSKVQNQPLNYVTTTSVLKKVYYNQVPISFDYYIIPNWSVGVGVIYNNLAGHVSQQDVRKKMYGSANDSVISSTIVTNNSNDSNITITKNSFQGLIESQYQWKQLSFGVRYAIGLQSYLKYNDPTSGNTIDKKNDALTLFVRYDLWDPKRKRRRNNPVSISSL